MPHRFENRCHPMTNSKQHKTIMANTNRRIHTPTPWSRREMLKQCGAGFGSLALSALLADQAAAELRPDEQSANPLAPRAPHFAPKAKRVIFLFMHGGPSQIDTFDPKPLLTRDHGKPLPFDKPRVVSSETCNLLQSPWKFKQYGESGIPVS